MTATDLTDAQITVGGALEWVVVRKADARNRVRFWVAGITSAASKSSSR